MANTKSVTAKAYAGEKRPSRLKQTPGNRPARPPSPPRDLSPMGRTIWRKLAPVVWRAGFLSDTDEAAFALLIETLATEKLARADIARDGLTVATGAGGMKPHPSIRTAEQARIMAVRLLAQFGMTPHSRSRTDPIPVDTGDNPFSEFLQ